MRTRKISPPLMEKRHTVYRKFGKHSTPANQTMQRMLSLAAPDTPDVAASGATTQWANGPTAPPRNKQLNGLRPNALNGSIGSLDMATLCIGSLADKNMYLGKRNPHESPWNCRY